MKASSLAFWLFVLQLASNIIYMYAPEIHKHTFSIEHEDTILILFLVTYLITDAIEKKSCIQK